MKRILLTITLTISPIIAECDWNEDGTLNVIDVVETVDCILNSCWDGSQCDWNWDGTLNVIDVVETVDCILTNCWSQPVLFEVVFIPAGEFTWGENDDILSIEYNYEIMKYEVTNNQYLTFMEDALSQGFISVNTTTVQGYYSGDEYWDAGIYEFYNLNGNYSRISWDGSFFSVIPGYENHPVNHVSWFGAWAMGEYHGMRLPTEREWEKAARGDTGWDYPWGDEIDGSRANYRDSGDPWDNDTTPIGLYNGQSYEGFQTTDSPSPYGVYDVSGNVWEWTNSFFDDSGNRVLRGGCWINQYTYIQQLKTWTNSFVQNNSGTAYEGFRLMKTIP